MDTQSLAGSDPTPWPYVLPLLVFMLFGMIEPRFPNTTALADTGVADNAEEDLTPQQLANQNYVRQQERNTTAHYCLIYALKLVVTSAVVLWYWRILMKAFPFRASWWALAAGVVGVVVWIGLCELNLESTVLGMLGVPLPEVRSQFNPFRRIDDETLRAAFLGLRFLGLVVVVPIVEELFLRGFLMRYFAASDWWNVPLRQLGARALVVAPIYGVLTHPTEALAAIAWFSLVTWLVRRTGNFFDAVIAHAVTNLLLGVYVCNWSRWELW